MGAGAKSPFLSGLQWCITCISMILAFCGLCVWLSAGDVYMMTELKECKGQGGGATCKYFIDGLTFDTYFPDIQNPNHDNHTRVFFNIRGGESPLKADWTEEINTNSTLWGIEPYSREGMIGVSFVTMIIALSMSALAKWIKYKRNPNMFIKMLVLFPIGFTPSCVSTAFTGMKCKPTTEDSNIFVNINLGWGFIVFLIVLLPLMFVCCFGCCMVTGKSEEKAFQAMVACLCCVGISFMPVFFMGLIAQPGYTVQGGVSGVGSEAPWGCDIGGVQPFMMAGFFFGIIANIYHAGFEAYDMFGTWCCPCVKKEEPK